MPIEKTLHVNDLLNQLEEVLFDISKHNVVYIIKDSENIREKNNNFILGPHKLCKNVLGLLGEGYGWPIMINYERIKKVEDITPTHRKHPFIYSGTNCVAVGIQISEYALIKEKFDPI